MTALPRKRRRSLSVCALLAASLFAGFVFAPRLAAQDGPSDAVSHKVLANGLEVFVVENHAAPLVTVCVAFRGGAMAQTPETAGLFHLYEHLLFTANAKYDNQAAFLAALKRMGVSGWNGATGMEYIDYYATVPSDKLAGAIEFWSWAVKTTRFDSAKLETEKDVVINEIRGYHNDPDQIMENAQSSRMFVVAPWRKNIDGPEANIRATSIDQLKAMQERYYIPKNAALLIGGDVKPAAAFALAEKFFGDWRGGAPQALGEPPQGPIPGSIGIVYPDEGYYSGVAQAQFRWRGPDVLRQTADTYASDVLLFLLSSPTGRFKNALMEKGPGLYDREYIDFGYPTARDGGAYYFTTFLEAQDPGADENLLLRGEKLRGVILKEFELIAADPAAYFGAEQLEKAKTKLIDQNILSMETADAFVTSTLVFWWSVATTDYFFGYEKNCARVSWDDIAGIAKRYILGAPSVSGFRVLSDYYAADPAMEQNRARLGYEIAGPDNAFWWQLYKGGAK